MTLLDDARSGKITAKMRLAAAHEELEPEVIRSGLAAGRIVIPANKQRDFAVRAIGQGMRTKVNANIGTSPAFADLSLEMEKLEAAIGAGADAVMDLSTGGDLDEMLAATIARCQVMVGSVPLYRAVARLAAKGRAPADMQADELWEAIEAHVRAGVDFITVHCGITRESARVLFGCRRLTGVVSRGGSLLVEWMEANGTENPLYRDFDRLLEIARAFDVTLSLGDGLRPGCIFDAQDRGQIQELVILGQLARRARKAGVQVMIEGPGHVPLSRIAADVKLEKNLCDQAPYYVLGPLPTDVAAGHDHIAGAIGGALAAASGADFLCYVTPAEHLCLPDVNDVRQGVIAARIAAHIGDLEKGIAAAWKQDRRMACARRDFNWQTMFAAALDPETARLRRVRQMETEPEACTMCGQLCALKTYDRALQGKGCVQAAQVLKREL